MSDPICPYRIVKLGGSLLELADVVARLRQWLATEPGQANVIVVGGGRLTDAIREYDKLHDLGELAAHWLCIRAMSLNAELVSALLPEANLSTSLAELQARRPPSGTILFDPWTFLRCDEPNLAVDPLPATWLVTSDSIAARLAEILGADQLVLLKSALPPPSATLASAAAAGYVDRYFPVAAAKLRRIECVNFRSDDFASISIPEP
ncbi:MAG TPA: hypothetical protein VGX76_22295 [Pirellulales bacterium]|nr:hypothetical protein [Pirellulales bacterium]